MLHNLHRLTTHESGLFDELLDNRIRMHLPLEQERIGFRWLSDALSL